MLWYCHNAINVYHVVVPWRSDPLYNERLPIDGAKANNKGPAASDPHPNDKKNPPQIPARLCSEQEASIWLTPGTLPWYFAQGLTPPEETVEKDNGNG